MNRRLGHWTLLILVAVAYGSPDLRADAKPDLSSPKKAATVFALGLQKGDIAAIKQSTIGSPEDYKLIDTVAGMMGAAGRLRDAAVVRFGPEEGKKVAKSTMASSDLAAQIEGSNEKVEGDNASIVKPGATEDNAVKLKKVGGDWKVDLNQFPQKQALAQTIPMLDAAQKVLAQGATDVAAGKYASADEASQGIQQQLFQVMAMLARQMQPATQPQGAPAQQNHN